MPSSDQEIVLITGGTGAIGEAVCKHFGESGAHIIANCHPADIERSETVAAAMQNSGIKISLAPFDVTDHEQCQTRIAELDACLLYTSPSPRDRG